MKYKDESGEVRMQSANYVSYLAFVGPIPEGNLARTTCGNRLCVNPAHLELFDPDGWRKQVHGEENPDGF